MTQSKNRNHLFIFKALSSDLVPSTSKSRIKKRERERQTDRQRGKKILTAPTACRLLGPSKGFAVHFGHPSWNTVLNMMVGIRLAGGRTNNEPRRAIEAYDFVMKEKMSILPRSQEAVGHSLKSSCFVVSDKNINSEVFFPLYCSERKRYASLTMLQWCSVKFGNSSG